MEKVTIALDVPKQVYQLTQDLVALVELVDEQLEDGFQTVEDGSVILFSKELVALVKSFASYKQVLAEVKEDREGAIVAMLLGLRDALKKIQD